MRKSGRVLQFANARQPKPSQSLQGLLKTQVLKITHNLQERAKEAVFSTASPDDSCEQDMLDITGMERTVASVRRKKKKKTAKDSLQHTGKIKFDSAPETRVFGPPDLTEVSLNHWPCFLIRKYKGGKNCYHLKGHGTLKIKDSKTLFLVSTKGSKGIS